jgi:type II secretory pathway component PulF
MPLIVTPGQLTRRSELYHQLAQLTAAGLGLIHAVGQLQRHPPSRSYRGPLRRVLDELAKGFTFSESMQRAGSWATAFDIALLEAGERSGRLDACFRVLAEYYSDRARLARQMIADLAYPAFLLHFAVFIFPFPKLFLSGNWLAYLAQTFGLLIPLYALLAVVVFAAQAKHGEVWRSFIEKLIRPIPVLGTARRELALSRLAMALEALISAGVSIIEAWELAATVSGSPALRRTVYAWGPDVRAGATPAEALNASGRFPDLFANQYMSGEVSGKLDEVLRRLHQYYQEEGTRKMRAVAQWTPRLIYLMVALGIGYYIIKFWSDYFGQIQKVMDGS